MIELILPFWARFSAAAVALLEPANLLQFLMLASGAAAMLLASRSDGRAKWGWLVGLLSQPLWLFATWRAGQWGMLLLSLVYTWGWGQGAWNAFDLERLRLLRAWRSRR